MKKLILILSLIFTVTLSSPSYAEWTKVEKNLAGDTYYVDYERIKKIDGYVYFWQVTNFSKPKTGFLSSIIYHQVDCKLLRYKWLTFFGHREEMGGGDGVNLPIPKKHENWKYPPPDTISEVVTWSVCTGAKLN